MVQIIILERRNGIDISWAPGKNNWIQSSEYVNVLKERDVYTLFTVLSIF